MRLHLTQNSLPTQESTVFHMLKHPFSSGVRIKFCHQFLCLRNNVLFEMELYIFWVGVDRRKAAYHGFLNVRNNVINKSHVTSQPDICASACRSLPRLSRNPRRLACPLYERVHALCFRRFRKFLVRGGTKLAILQSTCTVHSTWVIRFFFWSHLLLMPLFK